MWVSILLPDKTRFDTVNLPLSLIYLIGEEQESILQPEVYKEVEVEREPITDAMIAHKAIEEMMYLASIHTCEQDIRMVCKSVNLKRKSHDKSCTLGFF